MELSEEDVLSLGLKSKKEVADAMADVSVALFQKARCRVYVYVAVLVDIRGTREQEDVVIRHCCCTRLAAVAMRGALNLAARIMSCENPQIS